MAQPPESAPESTAALLAGYVHAAGVRHVFGYPGESVIEFMPHRIRVVSACARHRRVHATRDAPAPLLPPYC